MMITSTSIFLITHIIFSLNIVASKAATAYIERVDTIDRNDFLSGSYSYRFGTVFHLTPDASHLVGGTLGWREGATRGGGDVRVYKKFPGGGDGSGDDYYAQIGGDVKYEESNEGFWDGAIEFDVNEAKISGMFFGMPFLIDCMRWKGCYILFSHPVECSFSSCICLC